VVPVGWKKVEKRTIAMISKPREEDTKFKSFCHSSVENNSLVEQAAEQLATLLWKSWLHKKNAKSKEDKMKNHPKLPSTAS
jgi:hypothetical protein